MSAARMRVALVYDALVPWVNGGAERRFAELARELSADHDVTMISWQWWDGPARIQRDRVAYVGVGRAPAFYGENGKRTVREAAAFAARIVPVLLRGRWDVVDCSATPYVPLYTTWLATRVTRTPLVATWHECWGSHWAEYLPDRPVVARIAQSLESRARRLADTVVAVSPFTLDRMGLATSARHRVVGNGVAAAPPRPGHELGRKRDLDVIAVGRLIDAKRIDLLIGAVAALRRLGRDVTATIVGDGPARSRLEGLVDAHGVADLITFTGRVDEATRADLLGRSKLAVLPSQREGFGIGVLEAKAGGAVPIVASGPHTAAAHLVTDGVDGLVVEADEEALAVAIERLLADDTLRAALQQAAGDSVRRHGWDRIAAEMAAIYADVARPRRVLAASA